MLEEVGTRATRSEARSVESSEDLAPRVVAMNRYLMCVDCD